MTWSDCLYTIWNYRHDPSVSDATHLIAFIDKENLLSRPETAIPYTGVVTALCERHPIMCQEWLVSPLHKTIDRAFSIVKNRRAKEDLKWAELIMMRWLIHGTDYEAWNLLILCHYAPTENQRVAAQSACDKICRALDDGRAMTDSKGNLVGKTQFDDMRLQMLRLANEFRRMSHIERKQPFEAIAWSKETQAVQLAQ